MQRVPETESQGRIHTSTATVAVMPEAEEVEVEIDPNELKIDVYRSTGPGGQSVNTTDSAVRITHLPTGTVVAMQDEKSQLQNKQKALRVLRARLFELERERQQAELDATRRSQIGSGERAEKIRTYNFPENRVTDHRIHLTQHKLDRSLEGELDEFTEALTAEERRRATTARDRRRGPAPRDGVPRRQGRREPAARRGAPARRTHSALARRAVHAPRPAARRRRARRVPRARAPARRARAARVRARRVGLPAADAEGRPRALVPRPETEVVVERCLALLDGRPEPRVLDVGIGTGAIALAIADEHPGARVDGARRPPEALALARENAERRDPDRVRAGRPADGLREGQYDLVVSNPPYVSPEEIETLQPEVRDWEPRLATVGSEHTQLIAEHALEALPPGGRLVLEVADTRAGRGGDLLEALGYDEVVGTLDLAGRDRIVEGVRP